MCKSGAWCVALSEEHKLRKYKNRVFRRIIGKREEVTGG
jgi:hypothetical protein